MPGLLDAYEPWPGQSQRPQKSGLLDPWAWRSDMDAPKPSALATLKPGPAPTGKDKLFDSLYGLLGGTPEKRSLAETLASAFDVGTLGMATGAYDGAKDLAQTGRPASLAMALMPGARVAAPVAKVAEKTAERGIRAFHVSPHQFDKFDRSKVGSGIGATTEGHGLYFTDSDKLINEYAKDMPVANRYEVNLNVNPKKILNWDELDTYMQSLLSTPEGAEYARQAGIQGVRVPNTRGDYSGSNNYTIFDDGAVDILNRGPAKGIRAFHGSPHDFDRFSLDKIGTGEGAQAYGHGLYFAENEGVARDYRNKLSGKPAPVSQGDADSYRAAVLSRLGGGADAVPSIEMKQPGRMYEVNIKANPDDFLDWDKPLSQQSDKVRRSIEPALKKAAADMGQGASPEKIAQFEAMGLKNIADRMRPKEIDPWSLDVTTLAKQYPTALREAGIPGVRYLDQGSRGAGEGSRNYAVFDDSLIEILRKYGLLPPAAAGAVAASQSDPAQASP